MAVLIAVPRRVCSRKDTTGYLSVVIVAETRFRDITTVVTPDYDRIDGSVPRIGTATAGSGLTDR
jgi:hypothetical protein